MTIKIIEHYALSLVEKRRLIINIDGNTFTMQSTLSPIDAIVIQDIAYSVPAGISARIKNKGLCSVSTPDRSIAKGGLMIITPYKKIQNISSGLEFTVCIDKEPQKEIGSYEEVVGINNS